jgi:hypothetical protein
MSKVNLKVGRAISFEAEGTDSLVGREFERFTEFVKDSVFPFNSFEVGIGETKEAEPQISSDVVVIYDNAGIPSIMRRFKKVTNKELFGGSDKTNAAFIINGEEYDEIYISVYPNTMINGKPYSLPYTTPWTNITNDEAAKACFSKGDGWHLLTAAEWGLLANTSKKLGTLPHGNTNCGSYHDDESEKGQRVPNSSCMTLTGSGPSTWTHDHTPEGVHDLCGNVWEMVRGLRLKNGALQAAENNNAAEDIDLTESSRNWTDVVDNDGDSINILIDGDVICIGTEKEEDGDYTGSPWEDVEINCESEQLKELALYNGEDKAYLYADTSEGEYFPNRGGYWYDSSDAGVFCTSLGNPRSISHDAFGFRSAYFRKTAN